MHHFMYHIPSFKGKYDKLGAFSGQSIGKPNGSVKLILQKKSSRQNQTPDELEVRKKILFLNDENFERQKNKNTKKNKRSGMKRKEKNPLIKKESS